MSISTASRELNRKKRELAKLSELKSASQKRLSQAISKEANAKSALSKARTLTQARSKQRTLDIACKSVAAEQKKLAEIEKKYAKKQQEVSVAEKHLAKEQDRANDRERKALSRTLKENEQAHSGFSSILHEQGETLCNLNERVSSLETLPVTINVLLLACGPEDQKHLRLDKEARELRTSLSLSRHRDSIRLEDRWAVRTGDLLQALNEVEPTIVHFSGHGSNDGSFFFEDAYGNSKPISPDSLAPALATVSDTVRMVVFNACFSERQAIQTVHYLDAAIGMRAPISDKAAVVFASSLYSSIGFGLSLEKSFKQAKASLMLECPDEADTPCLYTSESVNPEELFFVTKGE